MTIQKIIAIDGPSGAGKSSLTKEVAKNLNLLHIDSGAIYRCAALVAYEMFSSKEFNLHQLLQKLSIGTLKYQPSELVLLEFNGRDISQDIRANHVSMMASKISAYPEIRTWVNEKLHLIVKNSSNICVMEGRDIGSVIFPKAILKIFLTASSQVRAERRKKELEQLGKLGALTLKDILTDIEARDSADSTRTVAPLICANDAHKIDTSSLSFDEVLAKIMSLAKKVLIN